MGGAIGGHEGQLQLAVPLEQDRDPIAQRRYGRRFDERLVRSLPNLNSLVVLKPPQSVAGSARGQKEQRVGSESGAPARVRLASDRVKRPALRRDDRESAHSTTSRSDSPPRQPGGGHPRLPRPIDTSPIPHSRGAQYAA